MESSSQPVGGKSSRADDQDFVDIGDRGFQPIPRRLRSGDWLRAEGLLSFEPGPKVTVGRQPWALGRNPVGADAERDSVSRSSVASTEGVG